MKSESISYWMNRLSKDSDVEPKDENELSFRKIAEYFISRENKKTAA